MSMTSAYAMMRPPLLILIMAVLSFPALAQEDFTVNIVAPLEFYGDEVIHRPVRRSEIERLLDKKIDDFTFTEGDRRISFKPAVSS